jgi:hypothetical protein
MDVWRGVFGTLIVLMMVVLACGTPAQGSVPVVEQDVPTARAMTPVEAASEEGVPEKEGVSGGPSESQLALLAGLPSQGAAPELFNEVWLNSEPLKLADLRGQVVMVEFWTFG